MINPEVPSNYPEKQSVKDANTALNTARLIMGRTINWYSADGCFMYIANSFPASKFGRRFLPDEANDPRGKYDWGLKRVSKPDINGEMTTLIFQLIRKEPLVVTEVGLPAEMFAAPIEGRQTQVEYEINELVFNEAEMQETLGFDETKLIDYAILDNALFDLDMTVNSL